MQKHLKQLLLLRLLRELITFSFAFLELEFELELGVLLFIITGCNQRKNRVLSLFKYSLSLLQSFEGILKY